MLMTDDEWQAHVTRETAKEIGEWLSARGTGKLRSPIASLTLGDLEAMAASAISRWIVLQSQRLARAGWPAEDPIRRLLLGGVHAHSADGSRKASATATSCVGNVSPTSASARFAVSNPVLNLHEGMME
jgi:hypothetical protein